MSKFMTIGLVLAVILSAAAYKAFAQKKVEEKLNKTEDSKILIAYFSHTGHTKGVAEAIQKEIGGDLFEIKTEGTYPEEYRAMTQQVKKELQENYRPKLTTSVADIKQYDIIFIGSPNWWGTIPPQVSSFIETYDLSGKTIVPFITHGGGGVQNTIADMTARCKDCKVNQSGWVGYGSRKIGVSGWLKDLGFVK